MKYNRIINLLEPLKHRSIFLLGPRQTGKTTLLKEIFPQARFFNLLEADTFQELSANPALIRQTLRENDRIVVIDEVQKLPILLDEAHLLIEQNKELRFVLTGSSARKLKRGGANLLAGRAWMRAFHPLVFPEVGAERTLDRVNRGSLPSVLDSPNYLEDLKAYVGTYLHEEIRAEGLTRSIENFSRFLLVAGLSSGKQINFENIGSDAGIPARTVREYYYILVDTLLGFFLEPFAHSRKRKPVGIPKFYLFDVGVTNFLIKRRDIEEGSSVYGETLEHLIANELRAYLDYNNSESELCYWRSTTKFEVDFTVGREIAIEVKGKSTVGENDLKGIRALQEENIFKRYIVVSNERWERKTDDGIEILPVNNFLDSLWKNQLGILI